MENRLDNIAEDIEKGAEQAKEYVVDQVSTGADLYNKTLNQAKAKYYTAKAEYYDKKRK